MQVIHADDRLTFNAEKHEYKLDGKVIPSTSAVLRDAGYVDYAGINEDILRRKAAIGTAVHQATEILDESPALLDWDSLHVKARPYVKAYEKFLADSAFKPDWVERRMAVDWNGYKYGMTLDRMGNLGGKRVVLDIKTSVAVKRWVGVQTASYAIGAQLLLDGNIPPKMLYGLDRVALQLRKDETYKVHVFTQTKDYQRFLWALGVWHERAEMLDKDRADDYLYPEDAAYARQAT